MALNASTKNLVGAAVLSVFAAFNAQAEAPHPLLATNLTAATYSYNFIQAVDSAVGAQTGEYLGRGAVVDLEAALQKSVSRPQVVYVPNDGTVVAGVRVVMGISPVKTDPVFACVEGADGIVAKFDINNDGSVVANQATISPVAGRTPCQAFLLSALSGKTAPIAQSTLPVKARVLTSDSPGRKNPG